VIARPGPYINAELAAGGLPLWLLNKPGVRLRHRNAEGGYEHCPVYGQAVLDWYTHIIPLLTPYKHIIAFQIENEYATSEMDPAPIRDLAKLAVDLGITAPLFHNDLYAAGLYGDVLALYAFDHYPVTDFNEDWRQRSSHVFSLIDSVEQQIRPFCQHRPLFVAECQAGWFSGWSTPEEFEIETVFGREFLPLMTKSLLAQGVTMFNHYLAVGGTNWGSLGAVDSHSSYDFSAPISESGELHESLYEAKALNQLLDTFDLCQTDRVDHPVVHQAGNLPYWLCTRQAKSGGYWVFYRNLTPLPDTFIVRPYIDWPDVTVHIASQEALILPLQIPLLASGWELLFSATECVLQTPQLLVIKADHDSTVMLRGTVPDTLLEVDGVTQTRYQDGLILYCPALCEDDEKVLVTVGNLLVLFASQRMVDTLWQQQNGSLVMGPVAQLSDTEFTILDPEEDIHLISPMGRVAKECGFSNVIPPQLPLLNHMRLSHGAPQLMDTSLINQSYVPIQYNDGFVWYTASLPPTTQTLTLEARHHWVLFVNQVCVQSYFAVDDLLAPPAVVTVNLGAQDLPPGKPLEVVILTDSLGVSKGFADDPRQRQGLLRFEVDGTSQTALLKQSAGLTRWQPALKRLFGLMPETSPIIFADTQFSLTDYTMFDASIALEINDVPVDRIDIYLNDVRVGRYRHYQNNQTRFQLPVGILRTDPEATNHLELVFIQAYPVLSFEQVQVICQQDIHMVFAAAFQKITL
jgi:hypothetical protein